MNAGARPLTAASPADALAILEGSDQDVLLISLDMPDDGGYQVAHEAARLRHDYRGQAAPIIAMCADASCHDARAAQERFALRLLKPIDPVQLVAVIAALTHHAIRTTDAEQT